MTDSVDPADRLGSGADRLGGKTVWGQARPCVETRTGWRRARPCGGVVAFIIGPKPKGGRGLPALIDSDDPVLIDSDPRLMD